MHRILSFCMEEKPASPADRSASFVLSPRFVHPQTAPEKSKSRIPMIRRTANIFEHSVFFVLVSTTILFSQEQKTNGLTLENIFTSASFMGTTIKGVQWSPNGRMLTYLKQAPDEQRLSLWSYTLETSEKSKLVDAKDLLREGSRASREENERNERMRNFNTGINSYEWSGDGSRILIPFQGDVYSYNVNDKITEQLTKTEMPEYDPKLSPDGMYVAFVRSGNIFVLSLATKKETQLTFDATQWIRNGESEFIAQEEMDRYTGYWWSPDSKSIAFAAKAGAHDAIHIVDVERSKIIRTYQPKLDGLWSPAWSPDGSSIAFMGMKDGRSDIMLLNLETSEISLVTNDAFSDLDPAWSPDGKTIAFVSDRGAFTGPVGEATPAGVLPLADFANTDIFLIHPDGTGLEQITTSPYAEKSPAFYHHADSLLFVSDRNGIDNIYLYARQRRTEKPLTNLLTGANQLAASAGGDRVAFTAFARGGYDIFLWKSPFEYADTLRSLPLTPFREREKKQDRDFSRLTEAGADVGMPTLDRETRPYNKFVFDHDFRSGKIGTAANGAAVVIAPDKRLDPDGSFKIQKYRRKFSIDYAGGAGGYDPFFGLQGYTQFYISDLAGNQQVGIGINLIRDLSNSDFYLSWLNLARRAAIGVQFFHMANFFQTNLDVTRVRNLGAEIGMAYPLSRFKRVEVGLNFTHLREQNLGFFFEQLPTRVTNAFPLTVAYVSDNTHFRFFGPFTGTRYRAGVIFAPDFGSRVVSFQTGFVDFRNYFGISRDFGVAWRVSGGVSGGDNPMRFFLGGVDNWLNYKFGQDLDAFNITDFYFSQFVTPLRGADYYEMIGTRYALLNVELRVPLVDYFIARFPLPLGIAGIRGAGFLDVGSAWNSDQRFRATEKNANGETVLRDLVAGYGWGFRANLGIFLLRMDAVWRTNLAGSSKPRYLFSFGTDF